MDRDRRKPRLGTPKKRRFHIAGREWTYNCGPFGITVMAPDRKTLYRTNRAEIYGASNPDLVDRADRKGYGHVFAASPGAVKAWVEEKVLGRVPLKREA